MNDDRDRLSRYPSLDAFGEDLLQAVAADKSPSRIRAILRRKRVAALTAVGLMAVPAGLAIAANVVGGDEPECKVASPADAALVEEQIAAGGSAPKLKSITGAPEKDAERAPVLATAEDCAP